MADQTHGCDCIGTEHEDPFCAALDSAGSTFRSAASVNYNFFMYVLSRVFPFRKDKSK